MVLCFTVPMSVEVSLWVGSLQSLKLDFFVTAQTMTVNWSPRPHVSIVKLGLQCTIAERMNDSRQSAVVVVVVDKCRGQRLRRTWQLQGRRTRGGEHIYSGAFLWIGLPSLTHPPTHPAVSLFNASTSHRRSWKCFNLRSVKFYNGQRVVLFFLHWT